MVDINVGTQFEEETNRGRRQPGNRQRNTGTVNQGNGWMIPDSNSELIPWYQDPLIWGYYIVRLILLILSLPFILIAGLVSGTFWSIIAFIYTIPVIIIVLIVLVSSGNYSNGFWDIVKIVCFWFPFWIVFIGTVVALIMPFYNGDI